MWKMLIVGLAVLGVFWVAGHLPGMNANAFSIGTLPVSYVLLACIAVVIIGLRGKK